MKRLPKFSYGEIVPVEEIAWGSLWFRAISFHTFTLPFPVIGYDPGQVNFGWAFLSQAQGQLFQGRLNPYRNTVERLRMTQAAIHFLRNRHASPLAVAVEGAAHGALYGQVPLAENRAVAVLAFSGLALDQIRVVPPLSVRAEVFGDKKIKAEETWPQLGVYGPDGRKHYDTASALACALYASQTFQSS